MHETNVIQDYHAHIYFDAGNEALVNEICDAAVQKFGVQKGRVHSKPVGPHPMGSCQLAATPEQFTVLLPWLTLNRQGLIVFAHPQTGDALTDHKERGIWLGVGLDLDFSVFS